MNVRHIPVLALAAALAAAPAAHAQQSSVDWRFSASIYAYLPSLGGSTNFPASSGGSSVSVDADKLVESLEMTFMGAFEARRGGIGLYTDIIYLSLGDSRNGTRNLTIGGAPLPVGASAAVDYDLKGWLWTLGGAYQFAGSPGSHHDVTAGVRMIDIEQTITWSLLGNVAGVPIGDRNGKRDASLQHWDFVVGLKGRAALDAAGRWHLPYYLDLGTGESDFTMQAQAGVSYSFGWGDLFGAWRYVDYDMGSDKAIRTLTFNGPTIGAVFRW
jgi:hypothetical protein